MRDCFIFIETAYDDDNDNNHYIWSNDHHNDDDDDDYVNSEERHTHKKTVDNLTVFKLLHTDILNVFNNK